jgi:hypothetical protein
LIWLNTATDYSINHAAPLADRGKRKIMELFYNEAMIIVANIAFPILSFLNICLIFHHWETTNWTLRLCRIMITFFIIVLFYEAIFKSTDYDGLKAMAFGYVPVTMLFAYSVLNKKI